MTEDEIRAIVRDEMSKRPKIEVETTVMTEAFLDRLKTLPTLADIQARMRMGRLGRR